MRGGRRIEKPFRERGALAVHELHFGPNMTPMVDVVMVILIFFMASTALLGPEWFIRAHLPADQAGGGGGDRFVLPEVRMEVRLGAGDDGSTRAWGFGLEGGSMGELDAAVRAAAPGLLAGGPEAEPIVVIVPEAGVAYQDVVRAHDACSSAGFTRVGLR